MCAAIFPFLLFTAIRGTAVICASVLERGFPPPGRMIAVGDYQLMLYCTGQGAPTVVLEPGMGMDWTGWRAVWAKLVESNRVCLYDRAGYGWSERGPFPRTALQAATELHTLLERAAEPGPFMLAGHSFGGYIVRLFAAHFPESVSGVILVEPSQEDEPVVWVAPPLIPPLGTGRLRKLYSGKRALPAYLRQAPEVFQNRYLIASSLIQIKSERNEFDSLNETIAQVRAVKFPREVPLTVITAARTPASDREFQKQIAAQSLSGRQVIAEKSGHSVQSDQPGVVITAIEEMIERARSKAGQAQSTSPQSPR